MRGSSLLVATLVVVLAGCSQDGEESSPGCTAVASVHGLGIDVPASLAPISGLSLEVCVGGRCRDHEVPLTEGSAAGTETCEGTGDDANCRVELTPDGAQSGFIEAEIPEGPVQVSGTYRVGSRAVTLEQTTVQAELSYPNGPDCGADGTQPRVTIGPDGLTGRS